MDPRKLRGIFTITGDVNTLFSSKRFKMGFEIQTFYGTFNRELFKICGWLYFRGYQFSWIDQISCICGV